MLLDNLIPGFLGAFASPLCFIKRIRYPELVSFGLMASLSKMKSKGVVTSIDSIWDVGANQGQFAFMVHNIWPDLPLYSFEPDSNSYAKLTNLFNKFSIKGETFQYALGEKAETKQLIRYENNVNNSLLKSVASDANVVGEQLVECQTLDYISAQLMEVKNAFLKLDVQGFELMVLAGAVKFLRQCQYVLVEVSFSPVYTDGAHAGEIMLKMRDYGFECIEIIDLLRDKNNQDAIIEADLLFKKVKGKSSES